MRRPNPRFPEAAVDQGGSLLGTWCRRDFLRGSQLTSLAQLVPLPASYKRRVWLAVTALVGFMLLYFILGRLFSLYTAYRSSSSLNAFTFADWSSAWAPYFLAVFMLKPLFFVKRGTLDHMLEVTAARASPGCCLPACAGGQRRSARGRTGCFSRARSRRGVLRSLARSTCCSIQEEPSDRAPPRQRADIWRVPRGPGTRIWAFHASVYGGAALVARSRTRSPATSWPGVTSLMSCSRALADRSARRLGRLDLEPRGVVDSLARRLRVPRGRAPAARPVAGDGVFRPISSPSRSREATP